MSEITGVVLSLFLHAFNGMPVQELVFEYPGMTLEQCHDAGLLIQQAYETKLEGYQASFTCRWAEPEGGRPLDYEPCIFVAHAMATSTFVDQKQPKVSRKFDH